MAGYVGGGEGREGTGGRESIAAEKPISRRDRPLHTPCASQTFTRGVPSCVPETATQHLDSTRQAGLPHTAARSSEVCITNAWLDIPLPRTVLCQQYRCFNSKLHVCRATDLMHQLTIPIRLHQTAT